MAVGPRRFPVVSLALLIALSGACAADQSPATARAADARTTENPAAESGTDYAVRDALQAAGPEAIEALADVAFLSNDYLEGRAPDTTGDEIAAAYIERRFRGLGLTPAFDDDRGGAQYAQTFGVRGGVEIERAVMALERGVDRTAGFELGQDFNPAGFSASAQAAGPAVFVGYAIERGPDGYRGFGDDTDLSGAIAVALRFEPLDETGASAWSDDGSWTRRASLANKARAAQELGAAGLVIVNTPGASDSRVGMLPDHRAPSGGIDVDFPVVFVSGEAGDRLIRTLGGPGDTLESLRREADARGVVRELGNGSDRLRLDVALDREDVNTSNVGAVLPGVGELADEWIIVGGHYDHLGYGYFGARDPENLGEIRPGADDNASGIAGMFLIARWLRDRYEAMPDGASARSVLFLAFGAEEMGLLGASHYTSETGVDASMVAAMLNLDMIGRLEPEGKLWVFGVGTAPVLEPMVRTAAGEMGVPLEIRTSGVGASDHTIFYRAGVPAMHFFTGVHDDYHTVRDTFDTLNYTGIVRVSRLVEWMAFELATAAEQPEFTPTRANSTGSSRAGARVRLGIMPDSLADPDTPGVEVGDVYEGTSAGEGGMLRGDRIIAWDGDTLDGVPALMAKLREHDPGDEVRVTVERDGQTLDLRLTLKGRDDG